MGGGMAWRILGGTPPTLRDWEWTLARLHSVFDTEALMATAFEPQDVESYYKLTTFRDYAVLAAITRCPAMHTELSRARRLPMRVSSFHQLVYVLTHMYGGAPAAVLEVGCGKGANTITLAALLPQASFEGLDMAACHVAAAQRLAVDSGVTNTRFVVGNAAMPPPAVASRHFNLVFGIESLCHLDTDAAMEGFLTFVAGSLVHGGRLVIVDGFRSNRYDEVSPAVRTAMRLAECGFRIRRMAPKSLWVAMARRHGLSLVCDEDLTTQAVPFWTTGWRVATLLLMAPRLIRWYINSSSARAETGGSFLSVCCAAAAFTLGSAEYGVLVFQRTCDVQVKL